MQLSPQIASTPFEAPGGADADPRRTEDRAYQLVTVAAILLVLGSLWLF